jgi:hypothetical protein
MAIRAYPFPVYQPSMRIIANITNAPLASVTTTFNHQYLTGTIVRLVIPLGFGMVQANQLFGEIVVTGPTTFTIGIDTTTFGVFSAPTTFPENTQFAQAVPFGENNSILTAAVQNVLPYQAS